nr:MAG TPA: hypothetical protein [Caudoviricetes sp.]DAJ24375.1 MAG TPA: hypothetical protein [Caudoviricetes sp.]
MKLYDYFLNLKIYKGQLIYFDFQQKLSYLPI